MKTFLVFVRELVPIWGWECRSCREEVGWCKHAAIERDAAGVVEVVFECGHCGDYQTFDLDGNETENNYF